ncbi:hypothetical protein CC86DRAFT_409849 [Ophiobolus disseminans]|uniref:Heterokaryon incompatibility domain-containing protein n=1 Tax=Ophiobolus disseminans TaxID=1469910 RepID=A0A6A6ZPP0_9PLEO|nr:hypothetical protein CC86DRAFT_409849 [Ophiobolus disseminans]
MRIRLSSQLYEKSTHFLLEIIQNADDNTYDVPTPTLSFSYAPGSLRIDCNEIGFTANNVEAICAINQSTKSDKKNDGEYIGEKGIGFKSVFKAADVVWISSREFMFKFDQTKFLGMVTPIWAEFPGQTRKGWTSIQLSLSKDFDEGTLVHELRIFDANLLIFLRHVKEIHISIASGGESTNQKISKREDKQGDDRIITLHSGNGTSRYLIRTYVVEHLPREKKRLNWTRTTILLGFPVAKTQEEPQYVPQKVYAFLPVRDYGLKFLLQGDFLLTASREDIESTLPWNCKLRDAVTKAFLEAVHHFNEGDMKYTWPWYLPAPLMTTSSFFDMAIQSIMKSLQELPVLESCAGTMEKAESMKSVPSNMFLDGNGAPFTLSSRTATRYLSPKYPTWAIQGTSSIGVLQLSPREFLEDLKSLITDDPPSFHSKSTQWHAQLAESLYKLTTDDELLSFMQDIDLVPLQDGTWTSARGKSMFFAKGESSLEVPSGIDVLVVDQEVESDVNRRRLLVSLGVKAWEAPEICRLILRVHESPSFDAKALTADQLISHAAFLYKASWQPPKDVDIWFATMQDERCLGRKLYIAGSVKPDSPAARVFAKLQERFPVINNGYLEAFSSDVKWPHWLVKNLGLSMIPRLITPLVEPKPQTVLKTRPVDQIPKGNIMVPPGMVSGIPAGPMIAIPSGQTGNRALQDYQMQLMLLEQQNKKRLLMARQEQDNMMGSPMTAPQLSKNNGPSGMSPNDRLETYQIPRRQEEQTLPRNLSPVAQQHAQQQLAQQQLAQQYLVQQQLAQQRLAQDAQHRRFQSSTALPAESPPEINIDFAPPDRHGRPIDTGSPILASRSRDGMESAASGSSSAVQLDMLGYSDSDGQHEAVKTIFALSDEFIYMFKECLSSDVLHILKDNWHHYSQWVDGAHMSWQDPEFLASSAQLKDRIGSCEVVSASGTVPLRETVLPAVDRQLDQGVPIPAVEVVNPQHTDWKLLGFFGVILIADVNYYLRCLVSISAQGHADIDHITYIYERIQSFYRENEARLHAAFYETNIVLRPARPANSLQSNVWINMKDCLAQNVTIEYEYPSSSYLFRCLSSPSGDPIAALVETTALITSSSKLEDISRLFRNISKALKDVTASQAAQLLRPLQKRTIFPVTDSGNRAYDRLSNIDDASWFIADRPLIRKSFHGKLPLLALSNGDIAASKDLLRVLRLDDRLLSKLAKSHTHPVGRLKTHWTWTSSLRSKRPFFRALVPQSHSNKTTIMHQIANIRGSVAPFISQTYVVKANGINIEGNSVGGQESLSITGDSLNLFLTEKLASAESPPYGLSILLADQLQIEDVSHRSLLYTVLIGSNTESIHSTFVQQGIEVTGIVFDKSKDRYRAQRSDLGGIPSPFWGNMSRSGRHGSSTSDVSRFDPFRSWRHGHASSEDRRLPISELMRGDGTLVEDVQAVPIRIIGWEHLQHLGEHLTSKILQTHLGHAYDPERDWTSKLRRRSGYKPFEDGDANAAFTLRCSDIVKQMGTFVTSFGKLGSSPYAASQKCSPIYHLDVVVNGGNIASSFVLSTSQIERMRRYAFSNTKPCKNISLLLKITDVYSSDASSAELIVDPWRLFCSSNLRLETDWLVTGTLTPDKTPSAGKRRKLHSLSVPWLTTANPAKKQRRSTYSLSLQKRPEFKHRALQVREMRLVNILPGNQRAPLQGVIIHAQSTSPPPYRALSYVWGTDQRTEELMTPDGTVSITSSLSKALHSLRRKDQTITLWVDAICINQKDDKEKEKQIRLLPRIFQNATFTYAFLDGGDGSDKAVEMLMQVRVKAAIDERARRCKSANSETDVKEEADIQNELSPIEEAPSEDTMSVDGSDKSDESDESNESEDDDWPEDLPKVPESWRDDSIPHLNDSIWTVVKALFSLPFFRRVWIVQEIVAAFNVKIVCGKWTIDWSDLHRAVEIVDRQIQLFDTDTTHLSSAWSAFLSLAAQREWEARNHRWSLSMLLEHFRYAESTLSRDRLFAMLGLASDGNEPDFEPDYTSPLEDVVLRFARVFVRQGRGMQLLYRAGLRDDSDKFPSWIPDWTIQKPNSLADVSEGGITFGASGPTAPKIKCSPNSDALFVDGYNIDEIESISASTNDEHGLAQYFADIDNMIDRAVLHPSQTAADELKWRVPIAGALFPKVAISGGSDLRTSYISLRSWLNRKGKGKQKLPIGKADFEHSITYQLFIEQLAADTDRKQSLSYVAALQDTVCGWRFVVTKKGFVGTVPKSARVGDVVAIMKGGRVPFILRKSEGRDGAFRLVGEGYVHGLMNGEGLSLPSVVESIFTLH